MLCGRFCVLTEMQNTAPLANKYGSRFPVSRSQRPMGTGGKTWNACCGWVEEVVVTEGDFRGEI